MPATAQQKFLLLFSKRSAFFPVMQPRPRSFPTIAVLAAALLLAAPRLAAQEKDIAYGTDPAQRLDFYPAPGKGPHFLVVFLHGGGWTGGQKGVGRIIASALNPAGYSVASVEYRKVPQTDIAGVMTDVARATAWLLRQPGRFGIDPSKYAVMGHSAGASMAALLGTDQAYLRQAGADPAHLAAVVVLDTVADVQANVTHFPSPHRQAVFGGDAAAWARYSPDAHVKEMRAHPRFCIVREDTNPRFVEQNSLFEAALKKQGEAVESVTAQGLTHGQLVRDFADTRLPMAGFTTGCLGRGFSRPS
jgi:acetyl esterase/lipase